MWQDYILPRILSVSTTRSDNVYQLSVAQGFVLHSHLFYSVDETMSTRMAQTWERYNILLFREFQVGITCFPTRKLHQNTITTYRFRLYVASTIHSRSRSAALLGATVYWDKISLLTNSIWHLFERAVIRYHLSTDHSLAVPLVLPISNKFWNEHRIRTLLVKYKAKFVPLLRWICHFLTGMASHELDWRSWLPKTGLVCSCTLIRESKFGDREVQYRPLRSWMLQIIWRRLTFNESHTVTASYFPRHRLPGCNYKGAKSNTQWCNMYSLKRFSFNLRDLCALETSFQLLKSQTHERLLFEIEGDGTSIRVSKSQDS